MSSMKVTTRKPAADRREEIVKAVLRIIGERGLTSLSTTTLAAEVDVTTGALYRHFTSLDEILNQTVRFGVSCIEETFPPAALGPVERIMSLARERVRVLGSNPGLAWLLRSEQAYLTLPEDAVQQLRKVVHRSRRFLLDALNEGVHRGVIRSDIEPEVLLVPVLGTIHAVIGMQGTPGSSATKQSQEQEQVLLALKRLLEPVGSPELSTSKSRRSIKTTTIKKES